MPKVASRQQHQMATSAGSSYKSSKAVANEGNGLEGSRRLHPYMQNSGAVAGKVPNGGFPAGSINGGGSGLAQELNTVSNNNKLNYNSTKVVAAAAPPPIPMKLAKSQITLAERLNIDNKVHQLQLGSSFNATNPSTAFHTIKYDFKPASVDPNRVASLDISPNNEVALTMPNLMNTSLPNTVYKGNHKAYTRECVLVVDKKTGEITLELLSNNLMVKKTRTVTTAKPSAPSAAAAANFWGRGGKTITKPTTAARKAKK